MMLNSSAPSKQAFRSEAAATSHSADGIAIPLSMRLPGLKTIPIIFEHCYWYMRLTTSDG
jgi:hypothetical protein